MVEQTNKEMDTLDDQEDIYKGAPGLDPNLEYEGADELFGFDCVKFILAQSNTYERALEEIKGGKKLTHWMWFVFPQLRMVDMSDMAYRYGITGLKEAKAYLAHECLGTRLVEISTELLKLEENNPNVIFGDVDAVKLKSSMTLFSLISKEDSVFHKVLQKFFNGKTDDKTLEILALQKKIDKIFLK